MAHAPQKPGWACPSQPQRVFKLSTDPRQEGVCQHHEGDMTIPADPSCGPHSDRAPYLSRFQSLPRCATSFQEPAPSHAAWWQVARRRSSTRGRADRSGSDAAGASAVHPAATDARSARMPSQTVGDLWSLRSSRGAATRAAGARALARRGRAPVCVARKAPRSRRVRCRGQPAHRHTHALAARYAGPDSLHRRYQLPPSAMGI